MSWGSDTRRRAHCLVAFKSLGRDPTKLGCRPCKRVCGPAAAAGTSGSWKEPMSADDCCCWGKGPARVTLVGTGNRLEGASLFFRHLLPPRLPLVPCWWNLMGRQLTEEKWNCVLSSVSPGVRTASWPARVTGRSTASLKFSLAACVKNLRNVYTLWPSNSSSRNTS